MIFFVSFWICHILCFLKYLDPFCSHLTILVEVSSYYPRPLINSLFGMWTSTIPLMWEKFFQYFSTISAGLALLNMAPIWSLDGGFAFEAFLKACHISNNQAHTVMKVTFWATSILLGLTIILSLMKMWQI